MGGMTPQELADAATDAASKLKAGTWDSVQALALASIAQSLAAMAARDDREG
jgi:hypothetical protein